MHGLYAITPDWADSKRLLAACDAALRGGATILQYRNKLATPAQALEQASALRALTSNHGASLIINDDLALALAVDADGVHLGGDDGDLAAARAQLPAGKILGASCYNQLALAQQAVAAGADYVAFGAVFASGTKPLAVRAELTLFAQARALGVPAVAIGGIDTANAAQVVEAGADCIAVIGALFGADDIEARARQLAGMFHVKQLERA
ncbi:thiamine-phosphate diphosphorylase [Andreprevotia lacus DSM 23236]|jgi:thiamine-phosphate pyrophosphorylase|uniref:Thiamine-phosphate synthase n=1 Tax=Andreprevotia lacus DSM 23236 TaxID=1121001 RepID=A0A1W1XB65_9NEIS|nr:thiamine phosphate synthase [Andreprevotia lacus]SMC21107.1 thiamine-phosphate diphosphorylase [Andreprevotia lacus DSM 23236]